MSIRADDLSLARLETVRARAELDDVRRQAFAAAASTTWHARAADAYRAAAESWIGDLDRTIGRIDRYDEALAAAERAAQTRNAGFIP